LELNPTGWLLLKNKFLAVLVASLAACSATPQKDVASLSSGIDTANAGHYRQAIMHEEQAEKKLEEANKAGKLEKRSLLEH